MSVNPTKGIKGSDDNDEQIIRQVSTAEMLVGMGKVDDAVAMLQQMLQERPENIQVRTKLKDIYLRSEMLEKAAGECLHLARIYEARGDSNRASDYLVRAKRLNPAINSKPNVEPSPAPVSNEVVRAAADTPTVVNVSLKGGEAKAPAAKVELNLPREQAEKAHRPAAQAAPIEQHPVNASVLVKEPALPATPIPVEQSFVTNNTALATLAESKVESKGEANSSVALSTEVRSETSLIVKPSTRVQPSQTKKRQRRWMKFSAIAATCMAILISAAIGGLFAYDRYLDKQYAALVPADLKQAPPSLPEAYTEAMTDEQQQLTPGDQIEAVTIADPEPDSVERDRQEPERPEREVVHPEPLPAPTIKIPPPVVSKPPSPAPPMIGRVNAGQGGMSSGAGATAPAGLPMSDSPPPLPPPQAVRKSGGVVRGRVLKRVDPINPTAAMSRVTGTVVVEVLVDERGNVASARAVSGHPVLQNAALSAARRWKFEPSKLNGTAVQATGQITFNFK